MIHYTKYCEIKITNIDAVYIAYVDIKELLNYMRLACSMTSCTFWCHYLVYMIIVAVEKGKFCYCDTERFVIEAFVDEV